MRRHRPWPASSSPLSRAARRRHCPGSPRRLRRLRASRPHRAASARAASGAQPASHRRLGPSWRRVCVIWLKRALLRLQPAARRARIARGALRPRPLRRRHVVLQLAELVCAPGRHALATAVRRMRRLRFGDGGDLCSQRPRPPRRRRRLQFFALSPSPAAGTHRPLWVTPWILVGLARRRRRRRTPRPPRRPRRCRRSRAAICAVSSACAWQISGALRLALPLLRTRCTPPRVKSLSSPPAPPPRCYPLARSPRRPRSRPRLATRRPAVWLSLALRTLRARKGHDNCGRLVFTSRFARLSSSARTASSMVKRLVGPHPRRSRRAARAPPPHIQDRRHDAADIGRGAPQPHRLQLEPARRPAARDTRRRRATRAATSSRSRRPQRGWCGRGTVELAGARLHGDGGAKSLRAVVLGRAPHDLAPVEGGAGRHRRSCARSATSWHNRRRRSCVSALATARSPAPYMAGTTLATCRRAGSVRRSTQRSLEGLG